MADLKLVEKRKLERLLGMESGYVLDFTNRTFRDFILDSVEIDIDSDIYKTNGISKAKRLRCFWDLEPSDIVGRLVYDLLESMKCDNHNAALVSLIEECSQIAERLMQDTSPAVQAVTEKSPIEIETKDFFISYNSADKRRAEWIAWILEEKGYSVILQAWDFRPGCNFILEMQRATTIATSTVMLLSDNYLEALYTQPEWAAAFKQDPASTERKLLPIRVSPCKLTGMLAPLVYVDLVEKTEAEAEKLLIEALQKRAKPTERPVFEQSVYSAETSHTDDCIDDAQPSKRVAASPSLEQPFSVQERLSLIRTLNALPISQFEEVVFALNPPAGNIPSNAASQSSRSAVLLAWVESPTGPGISEVKLLLSNMIRL